MKWHQYILYGVGVIAVVLFIWNPAFMPVWATGVVEFIVIIFNPLPVSKKKITNKAARKLFPLLKLINKSLNKGGIMGRKNEMGIIPSDKEKALKNKLDDMIKLKNPILEMMDGPVIGIGLNAFDKKVLSQVNPLYAEPINDLIDAFLEDDYDSCIDQGGEILALAINTPLIDGTENEVIAYQTIIRALTELIVGLATNAKKKAA
jgi:hypothetical protein